MFTFSLIWSDLTNPAGAPRYSAEISAGCPVGARQRRPRSRASIASAVRDRVTALGPAEQSGERPASRRIVDGAPHPARLSETGSAEKRTARLARLARR